MATSFAEVSSLPDHPISLALQFSEEGDLFWKGRTISNKLVKNPFTTRSLRHHWGVGRLQTWSPSGFLPFRQALTLFSCAVLQKTAVSRS